MTNAAIYKQQTFFLLCEKVGTQQLAPPVRKGQVCSVVVVRLSKIERDQQMFPD